MPAAAVTPESFLDLVPHPRLDDGRVLPLMDLALVLDLAEIGDVGEQFVQAGLGERPAATPMTLACLPALAEPASPRQLLYHGQQGATLEVHSENGPHPGCFSVVDHQLEGAWVDVVAQHR